MVLGIQKSALLRCRRKALNFFQKRVLRLCDREKLPAFELRVGIYQSLRLVGKRFGRLICKDVFAYCFLSERQEIIDDLPAQIESHFMEFNIRTPVFWEYPHSRREKRFYWNIAVRNCLGRADQNCGLSILFCLI